jgi:plastocyanin
MRRTTVKLVVAVMALVLVASACSSSNDTGSGGTGSGGTGGSGGATGSTGSSGATGISGASGGAGDTTQTITIKNFAFNPAQITGTAGTTLTIPITNNDSPTHSFTLDDKSVSQDIAAGTTETVEVPLPDSGTLGWHCKYHPTMTGTITIA